MPTSEIHREITAVYGNLIDEPFRQCVVTVERFMMEEQNDHDEKKL